MLKRPILGDMLIMTERVWEGKEKRERETWDRSKGGTITSNRLIIDLEGRWGVFQLNFVHINILIASWEEKRDCAI